MKEEVKVFFSSFFGLCFGYLTQEFQMYSTEISTDFTRIDKKFSSHIF